MGVLLVLLASSLTVATSLEGPAPALPARGAAPTIAAGGASLGCDGMYWAPNVSGWYGVPYCYGHDEPTASYISNQLGSGMNASFSLVLPPSNQFQSQGNFYATIWFGGVVHDVESLDQQAFLEFQFYPAAPGVTGSNSGLQDCLPNGGFFYNFAAGGNQWFACAIVWELNVFQGDAEIDAANAAPLDVNGLTDQIMVLNSGDHLFVNYTGVNPDQPWQLNVVDTTLGQTGTILLQNSSRTPSGLGPYYTTTSVGNFLQWGASGPGAISFAYEIGHSLNPSIPNTCSPGDGVCDSYWPGRWYQTGPMQLSLPILSQGATAGYPLRMYFSSSQLGEAEVNASACGRPSFSTSINCLYPYYDYQAANYSFAFGAANATNNTDNYGNEFQFPGSTGAGGVSLEHLVTPPWSWLNVTVAPASATVEVNPRGQTDVLLAQSSGIYDLQRMEGQYWINASAPGCTSISQPVYLKAMANRTIGVIVSCPSSPTVPVSVLESGLPAGTSWSADLSGLTGSATGQNITFNVSAGAYTLTPGASVPGAAGTRYQPSPTQIVLSVGSSHLTESVAYSAQYALTTSVSPAGSGTVSPSGSSYHDAGAQVSVQATAAAGYSFSSWTCSVAGACSSTSANPMTVTMNSPVTVTANFATRYPVSFVESGLPTGTSWSVTLAGTQESATGSNITFNVTSGTYSYSVLTPISGSTGTRYVDASPSVSVTVNGAPLVVRPSYSTQYLLTPAASPPSEGTVSPSTATWEAANTPVSVSASPNGGYQFTGWSCNPSAACSSTTANPVTVTLTGPTSVTADFSGLTMVSFRETGLPLGTSWKVTFNGVATSATGSNISFNVTAGSYSYSVLSPISGGTGTQYVASPSGGSVTVGVAHQTLAIGYTTQYSLGLSASPANGGSVSPSGTSYYNSGTKVTAQATAAAGFSFTGWSCAPSSACSSTSANPMTVTVSAPTSVVADFVARVPVSFLETGLPLGTSWNVTLGGVLTSATGSNITFNLTAGAYSYSVGSPLGTSYGNRYVATPSAGSVTVSTSHQSLPISFQAQVELLSTVVPTGGGTVSPSGANWYALGSVVSVQATASAGFYFSQWSCTPSAACPSPTSNPLSLTLSSPINVTAEFLSLTPATFREQGLPAGTSWSVTLGTEVASATGSDISFNVTSGSYNFLVSSPVPGSVGTRYLASPASGAVSVGSSAVVTDVTFSAQYHLTVQASPSGAGTVSPASGWYSAGSTVSLTAAGLGGYHFRQWQSPNASGYTGTNNPESLTLSGPAVETAILAHTVLYTVTLTETGLPTGASWSASVNGTEQNTSGTSLVFSLANGSYPYLAESPVVGSLGYRYVLSVPSGNVVVQGSAVGISLSYSGEVYLSVGQTNLTGGTVSPPSGWYVNGTTVNLSAHPAASWNFVGWLGAGPGAYTGTDNPAALTLTGAVNESAVFEPVRVQVGWIAGRISPTNASLLIDGQSVSPIVAGAFNVSLSPGEYTVVASAPGYVRESLDVNVTAGFTVLLEITLNHTSTPSSPSGNSFPWLPVLALLLLIVVVAGVAVVLVRRRSRSSGGGKPPAGNSTG